MQSSRIEEAWKFPLEKGPASGDASSVCMIGQLS